MQGNQGAAGCLAELYEHGDFSGWKAEFPAGVYGFGEFLHQGARNDDASAIKVVGDNCVAEVYEHDDFAGWKATFPAGDYTLSKFLAQGAANDRVSAVRVFSQVPPTAVVAGPLSGSTGCCGCSNSRDFFPPAGDAKGWIKSVAPDFLWVE